MTSIYTRMAASNHITKSGQEPNASPKRGLLAPNVSEKPPCLRVLVLLFAGRYS
jgi:hypothetical protein